MPVERATSLLGMYPTQVKSTMRDRLYKDVAEMNDSCSIVCSEKKNSTSLERYRVVSNGEKWKQSKFLSIESSWGRSDTLLRSMMQLFKRKK